MHVSSPKNNIDPKTSRLYAVLIDSPSTSHYISISLCSNFSGVIGMNIAVFASGRGSNFQAIIDSIDAGILPARIVVLISNKSDAGAFEIARDHNIPAEHISKKYFSTDDALADAMLDVLEKHHTEFIVLAGYLKRIPAKIIRQYRNRILNIHPALLPSFGGDGMYGHFVHEAVIASGEKISGATVHIVDEEYDRGPIVVQKKVAVDPDDTPDSLAAKILKIEHEIFPSALKAFAEGRVRIEGRKVWITS
jgi:phosphoribosylglycinamide formyltransferase-1